MTARFPGLVQAHQLKVAGLPLLDQTSDLSDMMRSCLHALSEMMRSCYTCFPPHVSNIANPHIKLEYYVCIVKRIKFKLIFLFALCIFSYVRFSYLALVQDKKITCVFPKNACCTVYVNCPPLG